MSGWQDGVTDCQGGGDGGDVGDDDGTLTSGFVEVAATGVTGYVVEDVTKGLTLEVGTVGIRDEIEVHLRLFEYNLLNTKLFATDTQGNNADEFFGDLRDLAKAVDKAGAIGI